MQSTSLLPITIWMNAPSFYQEDFFQALINSGEVDLQVIYAYGLPEERQQLGWQIGLNNYPHIFLQVKRSISLKAFVHAVRLVIEQRDRIHVVNGIWAEPTFLLALFTLVLMRRRFILYSEAPNPNVNRSLVKRAFQNFIGSFIARKAIGILPVSQFAESFYKEMGVNDSAMYPFGYFRAHQAMSKSVNPPLPEVVFVGQLVYRKGIDTLLEAFSTVLALFPNLKLIVIGTGPDEKTLLAQAEKKGILASVEFVGAVPSSMVLERIARALLLVLPSRWDGWGLVVNEALSVGVPVVVSDHCGASDLIKHGQNGYIFTSENSEELAEILTQHLTNTLLWPEMQQNALEIGNSISVEQVVPYFISTVKHMIGEELPCPMPPWATLETHI
jgi:glycosyltransferase involved in cell wall biosynthesis